MSRTAAVLALTGGLCGCLIGENPFWDPQSTGTQGTSSDGTATSSVSATSNGSATTTVSGGNDTSASMTTMVSSAGSTDGTTGPDGSMGQPCSEVPACDEGQSCCRSLQCLDTCAIFCALDPTICPAGMVCEHGYCLLQCSVDEDCASWPGFTCLHDGTACENYDPGDTGTTGGSGTTGV